MKQTEQMQQWQLEPDSAEAYERYLVPLLFAAGAQFLCDAAALVPGEQVLDVACGTGIVARTAAARVGPAGTVVGLDRNEHMLRVARGASAGIRPPIEWRQGDALELPFPDASFDVVLCQQGLQFVPDRLAALREMLRVLVPGGRLAFGFLRSLEHNPAYVLLAQALERHLGPDAGAMMRSPFASVSLAELRELVAGAGFQDVHMVIGIFSERYPSIEEMVHWELSSSPFGMVSESDPSYAPLVSDVAEALRDYSDDQGVTFPGATYLVTARR